MELFTISRNSFLKYKSPRCSEQNVMLAGKFYCKNCSSLLQNEGNNVLRLFEL